MQNRLYAYSAFLLSRAYQPGGSTITRSDAFAVVVAKLGFKPLS